MAANASRRRSLSGVKGKAFTTASACCRVVKTCKEEQYVSHDDAATGVNQK